MTEEIDFSPAFPSDCILCWIADGNVSPRTIPTRAEEKWRIHCWSKVSERGFSWFCVSPSRSWIFVFIRAESTGIVTGSMNFELGEFEECFDFAGKVIVNFWPPVM